MQNNMRPAFKVAAVILVLIGAIVIFSSGEDAPAPTKNITPPEQETNATTIPVPTRIRPETRVRFANGTYACLTKDDLQELMARGVRGEETKANSMMVQNGGNCVFIPPEKTVRVISAEYNRPETGIGVLEVVGDKTKTAEEGAWALSIGAEVVVK